MVRSIIYKLLVIYDSCKRSSMNSLNSPLWDDNSGDENKEREGNYEIFTSGRFLNDAIFPTRIAGQLAKVSDELQEKEEREKVY